MSVPCNPTSTKSNRKIKNKLIPSAIGRWAYGFKLYQYAIETSLNAAGVLTVALLGRVEALPAACVMGFSQKPTGHVIPCIVRGFGLS